jgi:hypothetical protein
MAGRGGAALDGPSGDPAGAMAELMLRLRL